MLCNGPAGVGSAQLSGAGPSPSVLRAGPIRGEGRGCCGSDAGGSAVPRPHLTAGCGRSEPGPGAGGTPNPRPPGDAG